MFPGATEGGDAEMQRLGVYAPTTPTERPLWDRNLNIPQGCAWQSNTLLLTHCRRQQGRPHATVTTCSVPPLPAATTRKEWRGTKKTKAGILKQSLLSCGLFSKDLEAWGHILIGFFLTDYADFLFD